MKISKLITETWWRLKSAIRDNTLKGKTRTLPTNAHDAHATMASLIDDGCTLQSLDVKVPPCVRYGLSIYLDYYPVNSDVMYDFYDGLTTSELQWLNVELKVTLETHRDKVTVVKGCVRLLNTLPYDAKVLLISVWHRVRLTHRIQKYLECTVYTAHALTNIPLHELNKDLVFIKRWVSEYTDDQ